MAQQTSNPVISPAHADKAMRRARPPLVINPPGPTNQEIARITAYIRDAQDPKAIILKATPAMAYAMFSLNRDNRSIRRQRVEKLKVILRDGRFCLSNDAAVIDANGHLRNAQHRLLAIIETGIDADLLVLFGVNPDDADSYDTGARRSVKDFLEFDGIGNGHLIAAVVRLRYRTENDGAAIDDQAAHRLGRVMATSDDNMIRGIHAMGALRRNPMFAKVISSSLVLAYWKIATESRRSLSVDDFWDQLNHGERLDRSSPIYKLRQKLSRVSGRSGKQPSQYLAQTQIAAWIIEAWNAWIKGDTTVGLRWDQANVLPTVK